MWKVFRCIEFLPIVCSVLAGFAVIGRQCRGWFDSGYWSAIVFHDLLSWSAGRPISVNQIEVYFLNLIDSPAIFSAVEARLEALDTVLRWALDRLPLSVWLIVIIPAIWFSIYGVISMLFVHPILSLWRRRCSTH
jgi:hypothetical protein